MGLSQVFLGTALKVARCLLGGYNHRDRTPARPRGSTVGVVCSRTGVRPEGLITDADMAQQAPGESEATDATRSCCCLLPFL